MFTPTFTLCPPRCPAFATALGYAAGWETGTSGHQDLAVIEGSMGGYFQAEEYYPASRTTVIVLANLAVTPTYFLTPLQKAIFG
jgi:hypothetical protein